MNQKDLFQHFVTDVRALLNEGASPRELIEVLAAVSVDLALNVAPNPEYAFFTVLEGLREMVLVHAKRDEEAESESEGEEDEPAADDEVSEELETDTVIAPSATIH